MADKVTYPQIPSTVWWGVRNLLQRSPSMTLDERTLGVQLDVQPAAARQYIVELRRVGVLTDEGKATALAQAWRHDDTYAEAMAQILAGAYPESLIQIAPAGEADRQKVTSWFMREGLGTGAAGNKAATYLLLSSASPNEAPARNAAGNATAPKREGTPPRRGESSGSRRPTTERKASEPPADVGGGAGGNGGGRRPEQLPLNVNVQIHISADATGDQIESIFAAMRRYLYDGNAT